MQIFDPPPARESRPARLGRELPRLPRLHAPAILRRPLTWVIAAEAAVTFAFVLAAVHLLSASLPAQPVGAPLDPPPSPEPSLAAPDVSRLLPAGGSATPLPHPGLGESIGFLGGLLSGLNQDQASFEHEEWSAMQALTGAIRTYIETVMLPAVEKAAHGGTSTRPP